MSSSMYDVIIIGAGISGINTAYRLQTGIPDYSYTILEGRTEIGGTWSLFKYPGIRSDSDLHTFGFAWDPWKEDRSIADAPSILNYMKTTAARHGIDKKVQYRHLVQAMDWSSENQHWKLKVQVNGKDIQTFYTRYIMSGTGYYDYRRGLNPTIPNMDHFKGTVVHPQFWPEDLDYENKKIVVIGSGATAVTIVPAMVDKAKQITMLQRSPSYFLPVPLVEPVDEFIRKWLPEKLGYALIRLRFMLLSLFFYHFCRLFPTQSKKALRTATEKELPEHIPFDPHFVPTYLPWTQRMCITPGGDFFAALRTGKADIATGHIETISQYGIRLKSGQVIDDVDIIITATGLKVQFGGGSQISVDGKQYSIGQKYTWHGTMLQDIPNFFFVFGYTNASWTLGADATAQLFVRILKTTRAKGMTSVVPRIGEADEILEVPFLNLNSTYIKAAEGDFAFPKGGDRGPWVPRSTYLLDLWHARFGDIKTGLVFNRASTW